MLMTFFALSVAVAASWSTVSATAGQAGNRRQLPYRSPWWPTLCIVAATGMVHWHWGEGSRANSFTIGPGWLMMPLALGLLWLELLYFKKLLVEKWNRQAPCPLRWQWLVQRRIVIMNLPDGSKKTMTNARPSTPLPDQTPVPGPLNPDALASAAMQPIPAASRARNAVAGSAYCQALKRRWVLAAALAVLAAFLAVGAVYVVFPPKYVVQARLELISRGSTPIFGSGGDPEIDPSIYRANQQAILKSPLVLSSALGSEKLKGLGIAGQSPETLESGSQRSISQRAPEIMSIKLFSNEPDSMADLLNAVVAAYHEGNWDTRQSTPGSSGHQATGKKPVGQS